MSTESSNMPTVIDAEEQDYLYAAASGITAAGRGLFTAIDIFPGEIIALYRGELLSDGEAERRRKAGLDDYFINLLDGSIMDCANSEECLARFANDAAGPGAEVHERSNALFDKVAASFNKTSKSNRANAEIALDEEEQVCLVATRKIRASEEVLTDYGKEYWSR